MLHRRSAVTSHSSLVYPERVLRRVTQDHCKFNRQPRRLEFAISPTKQTPAPLINRQQIRTLHPALFAGRATSQITTHDSQTRLAGRRVTNHGLSNRHSVRLENAISHRKQTLGTPSNRHILQVSASRNLRIAEADRPPQAASKNISNRQWQILEINVNLSKQTIAPRSNRHKNALLFLPPFTGRGPRLAIHGTCLNQTPSAAHSVPPPPAPPQYPPVRNSHRAPAPQPTRATSPIAPHASRHPQSPPETSFAACTRSSHSTPDNRPAPATPRRTARSLPPTKPPRNSAKPAFPSPASRPTAPNPPDAQGSAPASASSPPRETPQNQPAPRAKSSLRDRPR